VEQFAKATEKEIRRILRVERCRRNHQLICQVLKPELQHSRLSRVDVPESQTPVNPKEWKGAWRSLMAPDDIGKVLCDTNATQYHQADNPFGSEPLHTHIGLYAETTGAQHFLQKGTVPLEIQKALLPETAAISEKVRSLPRCIRTDHQCISKENVQSLYAALSERISFSPSQWHIGHYKPITKSNALATMMTQMMAIPHLTGYSSKWWQEIVDIMLQKSPGDYRVHRLHIVALQESDFNQSSRLAIGCPILHALEDAKRHAY